MKLNKINNIKIKYHKIKQHEIKNKMKKTNYIK